MFVKAIPLEKHLWELKSAVYDAPYENEVPPHDIEGFRLVGEEKICYTFALESGKDITDLFNMTPYCYKTSQQDREKLEKLSSLTVSAQFSVLTYKRYNAAQHMISNPSVLILETGGFSALLAFVIVKIAFSSYTNYV